jgi:hypothetical protein
LKTIDPNTTGNKESNKIIERFSKIIHKDEKITQEDTPLFKNKYIIMGGILILSGLT